MREQVIAVVGATGIVGREMLQTLERRAFPVQDLIPVASSRSAGKTIDFRGRAYEVRAVSEGVFKGVDIALFSAGGAASKQWAPIAAAAGAKVIDNSSAWRMDSEVPLVVPEVNRAALSEVPRGIIANPNCSTIQMVTALAPLHSESRIRRIVVATYQAVSGAGIKAVQALESQQRALVASLSAAEQVGGDDEPDASHLKLGGQLAGNLLMSWTVDVDTLYQEEELKMVHETRKIFADPDIQVSPTAVRVPVFNGHAEAIAVEFEKPIRASRAREILRSAPGVRLVDDFANGVYPTPLDASGEDAVLVGRIREDIGCAHGLQLWVVADNIRKGAALNAVQIAEALCTRPVTAAPAATNPPSAGSAVDTQTP